MGLVGGTGRAGYCDGSASGARCGPGGIGATWNQQTTAIPSDASTWQFGDVSCQPDGTCMAVGGYTSQQSGNLLLTEQRQGSTWSALATPEPAGAVSANFSGISCPSSTDCRAMGDYVSGNDQLPFAEFWDGSVWAVESVPVPAGAVTVTMGEVSCTSALTCVAVGNYSDNTSGTGQQAFAVVSDGSSWTLSTPVIPAGSVDSQLSGISCRSASRTTCIAVGDYSTGAGGLTLAESWNGSSWTVQTTPNDSTDDELTGVSCSAANACTAVGPGAMAIRWNGTAWSQQTLAKPQTGTRPNAYSVSCTSATECTAAGQFFIQGVGYAAAEAWNGTNWTFQDVNLSTSFDTAFLSGVSCQSPGVCTAVGTYHDPVDGDRALAVNVIVHWELDDTPLPSAAVASSIQQVSCVSANACMAVADYIGNQPGLVDITESWNGSAWTDGTVVNPTTSDLRSVSCTAAKACTAVGTDTAGNGALPMAERWNGTSWTVQSVPLPTGKTIAILSGVSCVSATACLAVGTANNASDQSEPFSAAWNGTNWTAQAMPTRATDTFSSPSAVSCTSATACIAVGRSSSGTLAESWNGTSWQIQTTNDPAGSTNGTLNGVSCTSAAHCLAIGSYDNGSVMVTLSDFWNGTSWTVHATPPLPNAKASELLNVSCAKDGSCSAVGDSTKQGHSLPGMLVEQWDGTKWGVQQTVSPPGAHGSELTGVSCLSKIDCFAVGYSNQAHLTALAEDYT